MRVRVVSGGCEGADYEWVRAVTDECARRGLRADVRIYSFCGHRPALPPGAGRGDCASVQILREDGDGGVDAENPAVELMRRCAAVLGKRVPRPGGVAEKFILRNMRIAMDCDVLLAAGTASERRAGCAEGGTGWPCAAAGLLGKEVHLLGLGRLVGGWHCLARSFPGRGGEEDKGSGGRGCADAEGASGSWFWKKEKSPPFGAIAASPAEFPRRTALVGSRARGAFVDAGGADQIRSFVQECSFGKEAGSREGKRMRTRGSSTLAEASRRLPPSKRTTARAEPGPPAPAAGTPFGKDPAH